MRISHNLVTIIGRLDLHQLISNSILDLRQGLVQKRLGLLDFPLLLDDRVLIASAIEKGQ